MGKLGREGSRQRPDQQKAFWASTEDFKKSSQPFNKPCNSERVPLTAGWRTFLEDCFVVCCITV